MHDVKRSMWVVGAVPNDSHELFAEVLPHATTVKLPVAVPLSPRNGTATAAPTTMRRTSVANGGRSPEYTPTYSGRFPFSCSDPSRWRTIVTHRDLIVSETKRTLTRSTRA